MFKIVNNKLEKEFVFEDFQQAIDFTNKVGTLAEKQNHHPDILIHSYKRVKIYIFTHSENKITQKDNSLAEDIEKLI